MKKFAMFGTLLVALALTLSAMAVGVTSASALEWLCNAVAKSKCKVDGVNLEVLLLEDSGVPASVECPVESVTSTGTVGEGVADETLTTAFKSELCKASAKAFNLEDKEVANGCTTAEKVEALNTPWTTTLEEAEWDLIAKGPGAAGQPAYLVECVTPLGLVDDVCSVNAEHTPLVLVEVLKEVGVPNLVTVLFPRDPLVPSEAATCTIGGKEQGLVVGEVLLEGLTEAGAAEAVEFG
jgi:hypothetical protein